MKRVDRENQRGRKGKVAVPAGRQPALRQNQRNKVDKDGVEPMNKNIQTVIELGIEPEKITRHSIAELCYGSPRLLQKQRELREAIEIADERVVQDDFEIVENKRVMGGVGIDGKRDKKRQERQKGNVFTL